MNNFQKLVESVLSSYAKNALAAGLIGLSSVNSAEGIQNRPMKNNNPGNIEYNKSNNWIGQVGTDGRFAKFSSTLYGIRAMARLLQTYYTRYHLDTVSKIITKWAPPTLKENNTKQYIINVCKNTGFESNTKLNLKDSNTLSKLVYAMIIEESSQQLDPKLVQKGVQLSLNDAIQ